MMLPATARHDSAAFIDKRLRRERAQVRIEFAVVPRCQRAGHCQDEPHALDDSAGAIEGVAVDGFGTCCGRGLEGRCLVQHRQ
jgi:hypothetical protein